MKKILHAWRNPSTSNVSAPIWPGAELPPSRRNLVRLIDARLHAVSSRNMYSEHGFEALIFPEFGHVCHRLIVESYCTPGSAHAHAAFATWFQRSLASSVSQTSPLVRMIVCHLPP